jgi:hypothetical protein
MPPDPGENGARPHNAEGAGLSCAGPSLIS